MSVPPRAVQLNEANAFLKEHPEVLYVDLLIADIDAKALDNKFVEAKIAQHTGNLVYRIDIQQRNDGAFFDVGEQGYLAS